MRFTTKLLPSRSGNLGVLLLNNPKPLHALTLDMCYCLQDVLQEYYNPTTNSKSDPGIAAVLVKAASDETKIPAFCAGGDVKQVYLSGISDEPMQKENGTKIVHGQGISGVDTAEFFRQEYYVNHMLATANKPQISFWDGLVMGGGVGISIHGKYRVATENTIFAMPETAIGLFPDVGSMYWMPRMLRESVAAYLALTGKRIKAADLLHTGLATHYVPASKLNELEAALVVATQKLSATEASRDVIAPVLMSFHETPPGEPELAALRPAIDQAFGYNNKTVEDICDALQNMNDDNNNKEFGQSTYETLMKMSPTSMKVTLEGLKRGAQTNSITEDLAMEFRMAQAFMRPRSDFYEGIRAVLIDKDQKPKWNPATLEEVTNEMVDSYFAPIQEEWKLPDHLIVKQNETSKL